MEHDDSETNLMFGYNNGLRDEVSDEQIAEMHDVAHNYYTWCPQ